MTSEFPGLCPNAVEQRPDALSWLASWEVTIATVVHDQVILSLASSDVVTYLPHCRYIHIPSETAVCFSCTGPLRGSGKEIPTWLIVVIPRQMPI